jgi:hypothetical protein
MTDENEKRIRPPKPKKPRSGHGDIYATLGEDEPDEGNGTELAHVDG